MATILDRFLSSVYPKKLSVTQNHQILVISSVWTSALLLSLPWLLYTRMTEIHMFGIHETLCRSHFPSATSKKVYITIFFIFAYVLPIVVMVGMIVKTCRYATKQETHTLGQHNQMQKRTVTFIFSIFHRHL